MQHHFALTWDNTNGDIAVLVDGELIEAKTNFFTGEIIEGGVADGSLIIGQDRDTTNDAFDSNEGLHGVVYDVRIWNKVRSTAEIALNYQKKFSSVSLPDGLIANWQMDGFNGSSEVVDIVGGNNLSVGQASSDVVVWVNQTGGVTATGNTLTYVDDGQPDGWGSQVNSSAVSTLGFTDDYSIAFTLDNTTNFAWTVGLGTTEVDNDFTDPEYAIYIDHINGGDVEIRHNGINIGTYAINYMAGDEFQFYVNGTTLEYQHNGVTFATDTIVASTNWYIVFLRAALLPVNRLKIST